MSRSSAGLPSFIEEAEEAVKMSSGLNVRPKKSAKKAIYGVENIALQNRRVNVQLMCSAVGINTG